MPRGSICRNDPINFTDPLGLHNYNDLGAGIKWGVDAEGNPVLNDFTWLLGKEKWVYADATEKSIFFDFTGGKWVPVSEEEKARRLVAYLNGMVVTGSKAAQAATIGNLVAPAMIAGGFEAAPIIAGAGNSRVVLQAANLASKTWVGRAILGLFGAEASRGGERSCSNRTSACCGRGTCGAFW